MAHPPPRQHAPHSSTEEMVAPPAGEQSEPRIASEPTVNDGEEEQKQSVAGSIQQSPNETGRNTTEGMSEGGGGLPMSPLGCHDSSPEHQPEHSREGRAPQSKPEDDVSSLIVCWLRKLRLLTSLHLVLIGPQPPPPPSSTLPILRRKKWLCPPLESNRSHALRANIL